MSVSETLATAGQPSLRHEQSLSPSQAPLATLAYRSHCPTPLSEADLARLVIAARERNRAESITGMLIYEDGCFFQWLEGPAANLSRVWELIRTDPRHVDIEVVGEAPIVSRLFGDWHLKLAIRHHRAPRAEPLLAPVTQLDLATLARMLVAIDPGEAFERVSRLHDGSGSMENFYSSVIEPSARHLGDLWSADDCSELDVTVGLGRLQSALRGTASTQSTVAVKTTPSGTVLVVPQPREIHMLAAVLDAEVLWHHGWAIQCEFPSTNEALQKLLSSTWFDALDLTTSLAFRREQQNPRLTDTIRQARAASRNPNIRIVVSGRQFFESPDCVQAIGADAGCGSASQIEATLRAQRALNS